MENRSSSGNLIIALLLIVTFPIWIGILGGIFGIGMGLMGAIGGIIAALFGVMMAIIMLPFKLLFGWHGDGDGFSFFHMNEFGAMIFIVLIVLLLRKRKSQTRFN